MWLRDIVSLENYLVLASMWTHAQVMLLFQVAVVYISLFVTSTNRKGKG